MTLEQPPVTAGEPSQPGDSSLLRLIFGRRLKTGESEQERVGPLRGVPILGLDALGSAAYGPEAALTVLIPTGAAGLFYAWEISAAILVLLTILYFSYRQTIAAYPQGGGSYTVARENLGKSAGLVAASALLLDYTLNVAVGISAGIAALESAVPALQSHTLAACLWILAIITAINLRGVRDSGLLWTIPTYCFVGSLSLVVALGAWKAFHSGGHPAPVMAPPPLPVMLAPVNAWLLLRAFASGCTAMTGVEAVSNAVPIFAQPAVQNARRTLTLICALLALLLGGLACLVHVYQVGALAQDQPGYQSVISQLAAAVAGRGWLYYLTVGSTLAVLALSANTSFAAFPRLCRLMAEDRYLPASFANLGRRLVPTLGVVILAVLSAVLLIIFDGITDRLIPLFAVGAFTAFTMSQAGMVLHWRREGRGTRSPSLWINGLGALTTAFALAIIIAAKFTEGAWVTVLIVPGSAWLLARVRKHYAHVRRETRAPHGLKIGRTPALKVLIPIDGWNRISERALRFGMEISDDVTAIHIASEETDEGKLLTTWREHIEDPARQAGRIAPRLEIIQSPYRTFFEPLLAYLRKAQQIDPDRLVAVLIPELARPRWWEYLLHNHVATALKTLLLVNGNERVVVINVPWYLREERR